MLTCLGQIPLARKSRRDESQHESREHLRITHRTKGLCEVREISVMGDHLQTPFSSNSQATISC